MSCASARCGCTGSRLRGRRSGGWASSWACTRKALRNWVRQDQADAAERHDRPSTDMLEENRRLAAENAELRRVNEVLRAASAYFACEIGPTRRWS